MLEVLKLRSHDRLFWREFSSSFRTWSLLSFHSHDPDRLAIAQADGVIAAAVMIWLKLGPDPINPFFLQAVVGGAASLLDCDFVEFIAPEISENILKWPFIRETSFDPKSYHINFLLTQYLDMVVCIDRFNLSI